MSKKHPAMCWLFPELFQEPVFLSFRSVLGALFLLGLFDGLLAFDSGPVQRVPSGQFASIAFLRFREVPPTPK